MTSNIKMLLSLTTLTFTSSSERLQVCFPLLAMYVILLCLLSRKPVHAFIFSGGNEPIFLKREHNACQFIQKLPVRRYLLRIAENIGHEISGKFKWQRNFASFSLVEE